LETYGEGAIRETSRAAVSCHFMTMDVAIDEGRKHWCIRQTDDLASHF
jgi:hypothetical protein